MFQEKSQKENKEIEFSDGSEQFKSWLKRRIMSRTFSMPIRQPWFFIFLTLSLNVINSSEEFMIDMVDQIHDPEAKKKYLKQIVKNAKNRKKWNK